MRLMTCRWSGRRAVAVLATALLILALPLAVGANPEKGKGKGKNQAMDPTNQLPAQKMVQVMVPQYVEVPGYGTVVRYVPTLVPQSSSAPLGYLGNGRPKGNNGVGNGIDPQPPGNPPINDGPGTGPGRPGNRGGKPAGK